jgi:hypothetical protein
MSISLPRRRPTPNFDALVPTSPRAFQIFDHVPPGCKLFPIRENNHVPHLRAGEFAVVDHQDREYQFGEVYLINFSKGAHRSIMQVKKKPLRGSCDPSVTEGIWFLPLCKPRFLPNGDLDWSHPVYMSDGPLNPKYLPDYLAGRVIGIFEARDDGPPPRMIGQGGAP